MTHGPFHPVAVTGPLSDSPHGPYVEICSENGDVAAVAAKTHGAVTVLTTRAGYGAAKGTYPSLAAAIVAVSQAKGPAWR